MHLNSCEEVEGEAAQSVDSAARSISEPACPWPANLSNAEPKDEKAPKNNCGGVSRRNPADVFCCAPDHDVRDDITATTCGEDPTKSIDAYSFTGDFASNGDIAEISQRAQSKPSLGEAALGRSAASSPNQLVCMARLLVASNAEQADPLWPALVEIPVPVDRMGYAVLSGEDEYVLWPN